MKQFILDHKFKFIILLIILIALGGGVILYSKKKKAKEATVTDKTAAEPAAKEKPVEPAVVKELEPDIPVKEDLTPAIIEPTKTGK